MNLAALLAATITRLERAGVPYMITGSVASSYHGEPRATRDLDIVIDPDPAGMTRLARALEPGTGASLGRLTGLRTIYADCRWSWATQPRSSSSRRLR